MAEGAECGAGEMKKPKAVKKQIEEGTPLRCPRCAEKVHDGDEVLRCPDCGEECCTAFCIAGKNVRCFQCEEK